MSLKQFSLPFSISIQQVLLALTSFLIAFIPLFPKVPLIDLLPGYIVRLRLEDLLVGIAFALWLVQVVRKKITWNTPLTIIFGLYLIVGFLSIVSAALLIHTIPLFSSTGVFEPLHIGKSLLHYFRHFEYFTLFLIAYSCIRTKKDAMTIVWGLIFTLIAVSMYGFGQKYYLWPVYSTMNREFSKGIALQLTEHARVQSTFGGHYDLGGYLVLIMPLILTLLLTTANKWARRGLFLLFIAGTWLAVVSASRISFGGFVVAIYLVLLIVMFKQGNDWKSKLWWGFKNGLLYTMIVVGIFVTFGQDLTSRYAHLVTQYPQISETYHTLNRYRKDFIYITVPGFFYGKSNIAQQPSETPNAAPTLPPPVTATDVRPIPRDVVSDVPNKIFVPVVDDQGETTYEYKEEKREYSNNAIKYGLSLAIRLDATWPQALKGFQRNPLLGSGYATLNKEGEYHFTEADSSDNNFLRTLGETGLLGFATFYGAIILALTWCIRWLRQSGAHFELTDILTISFIAGTLGLGVNALMIDIFVASKVAFIFWAFAGVVLAMINISSKQKTRIK